jgi:hypothetical protein
VSVLSILHADLLTLYRLGNATPSDASAILQAVVSDPASLVRGVGSAQWRGRMGLDKEAQLAAAGVSEGETK